MLNITEIRENRLNRKAIRAVTSTGRQTVHGAARKRPGGGFGTYQNYGPFPAGRNVADARGAAIAFNSEGKPQR